MSTYPRPLSKPELRRLHALLVRYQESSVEVISYFFDELLPKVISRVEIDIAKQPRKERPK
jgi:hypothetical protein